MENVHGLNPLKDGSYALKYLSTNFKRKKPN